MLPRAFVIGRELRYKLYTSPFVHYGYSGLKGGVGCLPPLMFRPGRVQPPWLGGGGVAGEPPTIRSGILGLTHFWETCQIPLLRLELCVQVCPGKVRYSILGGGGSPRTPPAPRIISRSDPPTRARGGRSETPLTGTEIAVTWGWLAVLLSDVFRRGLIVRAWAVPCTEGEGGWVGTPLLVFTYLPAIFFRLYKSQVRNVIYKMTW